MPTNLYGLGDNYDLETAHVLPALLRKIHEAKETRSETVEIWGTGAPRREFLHVDDLADTVIFATKALRGRGTPERRRRRGRLHPRTGRANRRHRGVEGRVHL